MFKIRFYKTEYTKINNISGQFNFWYILSSNTYPEDSKKKIKNISKDIISEDWFTFFWEISIWNNLVFYVYSFINFIFLINLFL